MQNETSTRAVPGTRSFSRFRTKLHDTNTWILTGLFLTSLIFHVTTAARTVTFSDSGDFLLGINTVGNVHGPGYPLYLMIAKLFSWIFPFGSLPFRAAILSGVFASLTTCLIFWIIYRMAHSRAGGIAAALLFCFSYTFWYQSVIPETYSINTFFITLLIVLIMRWERLKNEGLDRQATNALCLVAFIYGLALANHFSIIFLLPAFLFFVIDTDWRSLLAPRNLLRLAMFMGLGLLPYLYEPTAAFRGPAYNYGDPSTLLRWIRHMTLYYQRGGLFNYPFRFLPSRLWRYFGTLNTEFPYIAWLGGLGLVLSFGKRNKKYPLFLALLFLLALLPVMTYRQVEAVLRAHFYYPSYLIFSLWIGLGVAYLGRLLKRWSLKRDVLVEKAALVVAGALVLLAIIPTVAIHYDKVDKSNYFFAEDMALRILGPPEPGAVVLVDSDNVYYPSRYMQVVKGIRPDVRVLSAQSIGAAGFPGLDLLARTPPGVTINPADPRDVQVVERNFRDMPVYSTDPDLVRLAWRVVWYGYLNRIYPAGIDAPAHEVGDIELRKGGPYLDSDAREAVLLPYALEANALYTGNDLEAASAIYRDITKRFQRGLYVPTLYSVATFSELYELWGRVLNQQQKYKDTVRFLPEATRIDPDFYSLSLAEAYREAGDPGSALIELDKLLAFQPDNVQALADIGQIYLDSGQFKEAVKALKKAVALDPDNARVRYLYGLTLVDLGRTDEATTQFEKALSIDPQGPFAPYAQKQLDTLKK